MRKGLLVAFAALPWFSACVVRPRDPFMAAERALQADDLLGALQAYDTVPVAHARYPEARAAAVGIELRMRRCHELLLEALLLRGEWRDREALAVLQRAREQWPTLPGIEPWIRATKQRLALFGDRERPTGARATVAVAPQRPPVDVPVPAPLAHGDAATSGSTSGPAPGTLTAGDVGPRPVPALPGTYSAPPPSAAGTVALPDGAAPPGAAPLGEVAMPSRVSESGRAEAPAAPLQGPSAVGVEDPVALALVAAEARLGRGDLEGALGDLIEIASRFPSDTRVKLRLARLLHQRALLAYGQGALTAAIDDWQRVLELEPSNRTAVDLLRRAREELRATGGRK